KIGASEVCKHTSGDTWFLNDDADPNSHWMGTVERNFIQEFIQFYNDRVLANGEEFHYEFFYDYYHEYMVNDNYPDDLFGFMQDFTRKYDLDKNAHDLLFQFDLCYNQLIAYLLEKQFKQSYLVKPYHPSCDKFLNLVEILSQRFIVNLHSLNHDLYLEYLSDSDSIQKTMDDGFDEFNSPYYGKLLTDNERYMIRLSRFTDKFVQPFRLFKLHGSIDRYWFKGDDGTELIKLKFGLGNTDVYKEVIEDGQYKYEFSPLYYYPDFLSGTTYKIRRYSKGGYYPTIFNHFERNLNSSDYLIIIGYGFGDNVINDYIKDSFLTNHSKIVFIVDKKEPLKDLLKQQNVFYIAGGVVGMDNKFILNKIGM
ncbi:MAG: hypothetical protein Q8K51_03970, partial [Nitrospirota bacterium]|nr:hypothetical protein [Nitrospirota bacterium]